MNLFEEGQRQFIQQLFGTLRILNLVTPSLFVNVCMKIFLKAWNHKVKDLIWNVICFFFLPFLCMTCYLQLHNTTGTRIPDPPFFPHLVHPAIMVWIFVWKYIFEPFIHILQHFVLQLSFYYLLYLGPAAILLIYTQRYETIVNIQRGNPRFDSIFYNISCYNSLVLLTCVSRSSCHITYIYTKV